MLKGAKKHALERWLVLVPLVAKRLDPWGQKDVCYVGGYGREYVVIEVLVMSKHAKKATYEKLLNCILVKFDITMRKKGVEHI